MMVFETMGVVVVVLLLLPRRGRDAVPVLGGAFGDSFLVILLIATPAAPVPHTHLSKTSHCVRREDFSFFFLGVTQNNKGGRPLFSSPPPSPRKRSFIERCGGRKKKQYGFSKGHYQLVIALPNGNAGYQMVTRTKSCRSMRNGRGGEFQWGLLWTKVMATICKHWSRRSPLPAMILRSVHHPSAPSWSKKKWKKSGCGVVDPNLPMNM
jgi:hypothetical protein